MDKFNKNDRVQVVSSCQSYHCYGTVISYTVPVFGVKYVQVRLDNSNIYNNYNEKSLKLIKNNEGDNNIMTGNFKVAGVKFLSGYNTSKEYDFALFDEDVQIGDTVVCDTVNGFTLGNVITINDKNETNTNKVSKEIVGKVDISAFQTRRDNRAKVSKLKNMMEKRVKELQDTTLFEMMAEKDDSLKEMLTEYKKLIG